MEYCSCAGQGDWSFKLLGLLTLKQCKAMLLPLSVNQVEFLNLLATKTICSRLQRMLVPKYGLFSTCKRTRWTTQNWLAIVSACGCTPAQVGDQFVMIVDITIQSRADSEKNYSTGGAGRYFLRNGRIKALEYQTMCPDGPDHWSLDSCGNLKVSDQIPVV